MNHAGPYAFDYQFDAAGNRTQLAKDGVTTYYEHNTLNQLTFAKTTDDRLTYYTYQEDGALDTKHDGEAWSYFMWDVDEAVSQIEVLREAGFSHRLTNNYDAEMKRVYHKDLQLDPHTAWGSLDYIYDGEKIASATPDSGVVHPGEEYQYANEGASVYSSLLAQSHGALEEPGVMAWVHSWHLFDALGSTIGVVDADGDLTATKLYDAFGNLLSPYDSDGHPYNYVGAYGYYDESFDLMLLWHRWYDPKIGRFGSRERLPTVSSVFSPERDAFDAIAWTVSDFRARGEATGLVGPERARLLLRARHGSYSYCGSSPLNFVDAAGEFPQWIIAMGQWLGQYWWAVGGAAGALVILVHIGGHWFIHALFGAHEEGLLCPGNQARFQSAWKWAKLGNRERCMEECEKICLYAADSWDCLRACTKGCAHYAPLAGGGQLTHTAT